MTVLSPLYSPFKRVRLTARLLARRTRPVRRGVAPPPAAPRRTNRVSRPRPHRSRVVTRNALEVWLRRATSRSAQPDTVEDISVHRETVPREPFKITLSLCPWPHQYGRRRAKAEERRRTFAREYTRVVSQCSDRVQISLLDATRFIVSYRTVIKIECCDRFSLSANADLTSLARAAASPRSLANYCKAVAVQRLAARGAALRRQPLGSSSRSRTCPGPAQDLQHVI